MLESNQNSPTTVPEQPEAKTPLRKGMPVVIALVAIVALIGLANIASLLRGNKKSAPAGALPMRPATANPQQVSSFVTQQQMQARRDAEERQHQQELAAAMQQLQAAHEVPGPEAAGSPAMTAAQRAAIYGDSPNAPNQTSNASQAQAEAKQRALAREKERQDAINSDTLAIDFTHPDGTATPSIVLQTLPANTVQATGAEDSGGVVDSDKGAAARDQIASDSLPCSKRKLTAKLTLWLGTTSTTIRDSSIASSRAPCWKGS